jgi:uncharacterized OB-fold protein
VPGDPPVFTAPLQLAYPYDRTVGPTLSRFFTGLRDRRIEGTVGSDGRRYVPPAEFDPVTGVPCTDWVAAESTGTVQSWTWDPAAGNGWALIVLDGSDVPMLHRVLVDGPDDISTGMRVAARWSTERTGGIADIAGFVPEGTEQAGEQPGEDGITSDEPINRVRLPMAVTYEWSAGPRSTSHLAALQDGRLVGKRCDVCNLVYFPPRNGTCPRDGALLGDDVELPATGTITTFCVVNVPFLGQAITPPYVAASIMLDGADLAFQHLIQEIAAEDVRIGMRVEAVWKPADEWGPTLENIRYFKVVRDA